MFKVVFKITDTRDRYHRLNSFPKNPTMETHKSVACLLYIKVTDRIGEVRSQNSFEIQLQASTLPKENSNPLSCL